VLLIGWLAPFVAFGAQPSPPEPGPTPLWVDLLNGVSVALFLVTVIGLGLRRPWAAGASLAAAALFTGSVVSCPLVDHHEQVGAWWFAQLTVCLALLVTSAAVLLADTVRGRRAA
jgi:hypothetical protein